MIQYVAGNSLFHRLDPRPKIIFALLMTGVILMVKSLWLTGLILLTMLAWWLAARLPFSALRGLAKALAGIILFLFVVQALFYPGETVLLRPVVPTFIPLIGGLGRVTLEGVLFAAMLAVRLLAMIMVLPLVSLTTPVHLLSLGMVRMGLPYRLAYTMSTALNLIPVLQTEANAIVDAQRLRAFHVFETGRFFDKLRAYPSLVTPLVIGAMRRAQLIAVAMDSRAFGAAQRRTYIQDIQMHARDWAFILFVAFYVSLIVVLNYLVV
jgi:energy-coupling factor transport system permease protein